jgi:hypothetical protein
MDSDRSARVRLKNGTPETEGNDYRNGSLSGLRERWPSRYEENLVDQLFNSSEKRLARVLLLLAHFGKDGQPEVAIPHNQSGNSSIVFS